ncbi:hypothetical protein ACIRL2_29065 [Embleya sp. NPDC127516]|uniref:hypothetical protein n=1 Tax=Embleya sp. NPDC127516 TaxID=3363990 RepID=UPI0038181C3A
MTQWLPGMRITAARLNDQAGLWTSYTPTWAATGGGGVLGTGGVIAGSWTRIGRSITARVALTFGTGANAGSGFWTFTLPVAAAAVATGQAGLGIGMATNAGVAINLGVAYVSGGATDVSVFSDGAGAPWGANRPFTWGIGDNVTILAVYEAAT